MKRIKQLQPLSKEHHQSLVLAQKAINAARQADQNSINELCRQIADTYPDDWKVHFQIEEDSIFNTVAQYLEKAADEADPELKKISELCVQLEQEHRQMDKYYEQIRQGDQSVLGDFGALLKQHTRTEERQLFPMLENYFDSETLENIYQTSLDYRKTT